MDQPTSQPETARHLVGVVEDRARADAVLARLHELGLDDGQVRVDAVEDDRASLRGEMRDELDRSWFAPTAGILLTKRSIKGAAFGMAVAVAVGVVVSIPFAFFPFWPTGLSVLWRLVIVVLLGATAGATVGYIAGASEAEKGAATELAAEKGVTVRVALDSPEAREAFLAEGALRLDVVTAEGEPQSPVSSQSERGSEGVVQDLGRAWQEPERDHP